MIGIGRKLGGQVVANFHAIAASGVIGERQRYRMPTAQRCHAERFPLHGKGPAARQREQIGGQQHQQQGVEREDRPAQPGRQRQSQCQRGGH